MREDVSAEAFRFRDLRQTYVAGVPVILNRISFSGELGYEIYCRPQYLLRLAEEQSKLSKGAVIDNAPTHAEIAGSIGANREMVSRAISKLAKSGVIKSSRQKIEILDPEALSNKRAKF